jgi:hypothetical protein
VPARVPDCWPGRDGTRVTGGPDGRLSQRQQAVLDSVRARHPQPVTAAQLAAGLGIAEGALNLTLRSLHRRRLIAPAAPTARGHGGWTAADATSAQPPRA